MKRKYVDATDMKERFCGNCSHENPCWVCMIFHFFNDFPAADVVEVVRCRECVMWDGSFTLNGQKKCLNMTFCTDGDFYCGWGSKE